MNSHWPYVAGILDGEGTICLHFISNKQNYQHSGLQVIIYGTSLRLMTYLVNHFGGRYNIRTKTSLSKKVQYAWHPSGRKNRELFLLGVLPYLVIKHQQAKIALEFLRLENQKEPELRNKLVLLCQKLNREDESLTTNTLEEGMPSMIESELMGDHESAPGVIQGVEDVSTLAQTHCMIRLSETT